MPKKRVKVRKPAVRAARKRVMKPSPLKTSRIKVISFDLDGTLVDDSRFGRVFWYEEIPRLYAERYSIPIEEATLIVLDSYKKVGYFDINWYRPHYWFEKFRLEEDWRKVIHDLRRDVRVYNDVKPALAELKRKHRLIVITHSTREFMQLKMQVESMKDYFEEVHSVIDDHAMVKSKEFFQHLLGMLRCTPGELLHVGDDATFDYDIPRSLGIRALLLDRGRTKKGKDVVYSLVDVKKHL